MRKLNFEQFQDKMTFEGGQSRFGEYAVSYILLKNEDDEEIFYAECNSDTVCEAAGMASVDESQYEKALEVIEAYDEQFIKNAYAAYLDGDDIYTE